ncbi:MAG: hypothetical protein EA353_06495 [Puniceicoccaceae bacterium]|nr:MAG: hypothetical protein EA353_06495 [Puniceicoccaceae bacterium]
MFKRIIYEDWASYVPIISFWFTFSVFLAISLRAILMKKDRVMHMGHLPLEDDAPKNKQRDAS